MNYKSLIAVCFLCLTHFVGMGQSNYSISGKSIKELKEMSTPILKFTPGSITFSGFVLQSGKTKLPDLSQQILAPYSIEDLAFFCRLEVKLEQKIGLPFKFRLGEVQYTERMEGKY
jgi:hypothetical protein